MVFYDIWRELPDVFYIRVNARYKNSISVGGENYKLADIFGKSARVKVKLIYM